MDINGVSAIVTGGASGIGAASARLLAAKGAKVVVADLPHQAEKGEALATEIGGAFCAVDVTNTEDIKNAVEMAKSMGPLRVLVNSAGIGWAQRTVGKDGTYESAHDLDVFRKVIDINLTGTFNCIRIAATAMSTTEPDADGARGAIVNTASVAACEGQIGQAAYSASKAALTAYDAAYVALAELLDVPMLLVPSIQVNVRAGHLPPADDNGVSYLRIPVNMLGG